MHTRLLLLAIIVGLSSCGKILPSGKTEKKAGKDAKIHPVIEGDHLVLTADNYLECPVSFTFSWKDSSRVWGDSSLSEPMVAPGQSVRHRLTSIKMRSARDSAAIMKNLNAQGMLGDPYTARHADSVRYLLPFPPGKRYRVLQSYFGDFSHQNKRAIDFNLKEGEIVTAARGGRVVRIKEDSKKRGCSRRFVNDGNYVMIYHDDGTIASYYHLYPEGSLVEEGDHVQAGDTIGLSGNTGFSCRPHLHFVVYRPGMSGSISVPTRFKGIPDHPLKEDEYYSRPARALSNGSPAEY
ncbi:MAG: M23 family metallopeptidase [Saprospiraceae bacterium]|nr:M23 family metallopeptidase [Saprospiraceae bacterium]